MKQFNFLFSLMAAMMLLWGGSAKAQETAGDEAGLIAAMNTLKATPGGGTITLTASISINTTGSNATTIGSIKKVILSSVEGNPITIDCSTFRIEATGSSGTWDGNDAGTQTGGRGILTIGEYVTVTGTGTTATMGTLNATDATTHPVLVVPMNNTTLEVTSGGKIINTAATNGVAVSSRGRTIIRSGALVRTESPGGIAAETTNYGIMVAGGTIEAVGDNVTALQYGTQSGTPHLICSGAQVSAIGKNAVGVNVTGTTTVNVITIGATGSVPPGTTAGATIITSSPDNSDIAIQSANPNSSVGVNAGGVSITASKIYSGAADAALLGYVRNIAADPDAGTYNSAQDVALTATDNGGAAATEDIYYGIDVLPATLYSASIPMTDSGTLNTNVTVTEGTNTFTTTRSFAYDITATGISTPSIDAAKVYIEGNVLYLPESGAVQVYNISGQLVLSAVATGATVDVSSLTKGVYVVKAGSIAFKVVK